jgi:hypothetical protein
MWWHGDLDALAEVLDDGRRPARAEDLLGLMQLSGVVVRRDVDGHDGPLAELRFHAAFEEEHGVGVLTDGTTIVGTGYSCDVLPFGWAEGGDEDDDA